MNSLAFSELDLIPIFTLRSTKFHQFVHVVRGYRAVGDKGHVALLNYVHILIEIHSSPLAMALQSPESTRPLPHLKVDNWKQIRSMKVEQEEHLDLRDDGGDEGG